MILFVDKYGDAKARTGAQTGQFRAAGAGATRRARAARLRDRPLDQRAIRRRHLISRDVALSNSVWTASQRADRGPLVGKTWPASSTNVPSDTWRTWRARKAALAVGHVLRRARSDRENTMTLRRGQTPRELLLGVRPLTSRRSGARFRRWRDRGRRGSGGARR